MTTPIKAPAMGESISEATVAKWLVKEGDLVQADQLVAELETDKVNLEVIAPSAGAISKIAAKPGAKVKVGDLMGEIDESKAGAVPSPKKDVGVPVTPAVPTPNPAPAPAVVQPTAPSVPSKGAESAALAASGPAVRKMAAEMGASVAEGSGKGGRVTKSDLMGGGKPVIKRGEERVAMTRIRKTIASRLKQAQNTAAMLTTYNEVDLSQINQLRKTYKDAFEKQYGVKLGYMGFFTKAVCEALKRFPALNAEIDGEDIVYKQHHDIGIAVSSEKGLVVPVVRNASTLGVAEVEAAIGDFGTLARTGGLKPDELVGATFSITNGGVFGSLMSMPILNYPQVGILGMHAIKERPVAVDGQVVIRPMMYLALTYDHRIVDGKEAVSFLVDVKNSLENPGRFLLGV